MKYKSGIIIFSSINWSTHNQLHHELSNYFSKNNQSLLRRIAKLNRAQQHRIMSQDQVEAKKLKTWIQRERESLKKLIGRDLN